MPESVELLIGMADVSSAEQSRLVTSLEEKMREVKGVTGAQIKREREDSQDAGTILSIVLAGPAVIAAVKALEAWLARNNQARITIKTSDGQSIDASGLESGDVPKIVEAIKASSGIS